jgi:hypothetical protein
MRKKLLFINTVGSFIIYLFLANKEFILSHEEHIYNILIVMMFFSLLDVFTLLFIDKIANNFIKIISNINFIYICSLYLFISVRIYYIGSNSKSKSVYTIFGIYLMAQGYFCHNYKKIIGEKHDFDL